MQIEFYAMCNLADDPVKPPEGSIIGQCARCEREIWLPPSAQAVNPRIAALCMPCAYDRLEGVVGFASYLSPLQFPPILRTFKYWLLRN